MGDIKNDRILINLVLVMILIVVVIIIVLVILSIKSDKKKDPCKENIYHRDCDTVDYCSHAIETNLQCQEYCDKPGTITIDYCIKQRCKDNNYPMTNPYCVNAYCSKYDIDGDDPKCDAWACQFHGETDRCDYSGLVPCDSECFPPLFIDNITIKAYGGDDYFYVDKTSMGIPGTPADRFVGSLPLILDPTRKSRFMIISSESGVFIQVRDNDDLYKHLISGSGAVNLISSDAYLSGSTKNPMESANRLGIFPVSNGVYTIANQDGKYLTVLDGISLAWRTRAPGDNSQLFIIRSDADFSGKVHGPINVIDNNSLTINMDILYNYSSSSSIYKLVPDSNYQYFQINNSSNSSKWNFNSVSTNSIQGWIRTTTRVLYKVSNNNQYGFSAGINDNPAGVTQENNSNIPNDRIIVQFSKTEPKFRLCTLIDNTLCYLNVPNPGTPGLSSYQLKWKDLDSDAGWMTF